MLYAAVWRWHFYAGLYVAPFLMLLALSGLVMLAKEPIERWQFGVLLTNTPGGSPTSHQARLDAVRSAFPNATFVRYQPGRDSADATRVTVTIDDRPHTVFVDANTGARTRDRGRWPSHRGCGEPPPRDAADRGLGRSLD